MTDFSRKNDIFARPDMEKFNVEPLVRARKEKKMTIESLSGVLGITRDLLGKYERGAAVPRADLLIRWANYLGLEIAYITRL